MPLGLSEKAEEKEDGGEQAQGAEEAVEAADQGLRNGVVDEGAVKSVGGNRGELEAHPREAEHEQHAGIGSRRVRAEQAMQPRAEGRTERHQAERNDDNGRGNEQERNAASPAAAMAVGAVAENRHEEDADGRRQRAEEQTRDEVGRAEILEEKLDDGRNRALLHRPREVAPEQPDEEQDQPRPVV
ncbi:MAG: hypothetical protein WDO13_21210 [Verrucomicrobiota bacterium]